MLSILVESDNGTMEYVETDPQEYIPDLTVVGWCREHVSKHACCDMFNEESCPICLDPIVQNSEVLTLDCGHTMHFECGEKWFLTCITGKKNAKCPLCNFGVLCPIFKSIPEAEFTDSTVVRQTRFRRFIQYIRKKIRCL